MSNAVRHAHPKTVHIKLTEETNHWQLTVIDDGVGMEEGPERCAQHGLRARQHARARRGHRRRVDTSMSKPGQGTRINVRLPKRQPKK